MLRYDSAQGSQRVDRDSALFVGGLLNRFLGLRGFGRRALCRLLVTSQLRLMRGCRKLDQCLGCLAALKHGFAPLPDYACHAGDRSDRDRCGHRRDGGPPLCPFDDALRRPDRPRENRLVVQPPVQILRERFRRAVPARGIFFEALERNGFQIAIRAGVDRPRALRFLVQDEHHRVER